MLVGSSPEVWKGISFLDCAFFLFIVKISLLINMFWLLLFSHMAAAWFTPIPDPNEVFNFWEPLHFLVYGKGQEAWEYSPEYAVRSYLFICLHALPAYFLKVLGIEGVVAFKMLRLLWGGLSAFCKYKLLKRLEASDLTYYFFAISTGMFMASHTLLPSTFCMNYYCLAVSYFLKFYKTGRRRYLFVALLSCAFSMFVGWPFAVVFPAFFILPYIKKYPKYLFKGELWGLGVLSLGVTLVPAWLVDSYFYGRNALGIWNLIKYSLEGTATNPYSVLFGTDPWYVYCFNLFLNFNFVRLT